MLRHLCKPFASGLLSSSKSSVVFFYVKSSGEMYAISDFCSTFEHLGQLVIITLTIQSPDTFLRLIDLLFGH